MRFLVDEMFPPNSCRYLVDFGHDAIHVRDRGVDARPDVEVATVAAHERRVLVTENVKDFAAEHDIVIVCVLKARLRQRGMAQRLAEVLDKWTAANPSPYLGLHWPDVTR